MGTTAVRKSKPGIQADQIEKTFTYHAPFGDQLERYAQLRSKAKELACLIADSCPPSRETSLAFTHLQESIMFANAAIAINESGLAPKPEPISTGPTALTGQAMYQPAVTTSPAATGGATGAVNEAPTSEGAATPVQHEAKTVEHEAKETEVVSA